MPWLRNNNTMLQEDVGNVFSNVSARVRSDLYRSRTALDTAMFTFISMAFRLSCVPTEEQIVLNRFKTLAMPRNTAPDETYFNVHSKLQEFEVVHQSSRCTTIYNTSWVCAWVYILICFISNTIQFCSFFCSHNFASRTLNQSIN